MRPEDAVTLQRFDRDFFSPASPFAYIGDGELGGKAAGLARIQATLAAAYPQGCEGISVAIPYLVVLTTEAFDAFMDLNDLHETAAEDLPDARMAHAFLKGELPAWLVGDLRALAEQVKVPLAVRSSSLLEDSLERPFAGVYATKMTPNNQLSADARFVKLVEAIKLVYASTYFQAAKSYRRSAGVEDAQEKMAVVIQEVVGQRHDHRYYPDVSGVARSYNYYPSGHARPEDGYCQLALGRGRSTGGGGLAWGYPPAHPTDPPPYNSLNELLQQTQTGFWAGNMGPAPYDPGAETEYLLKCALAEAEGDGTLRAVASTFDAGSNRLVPHIQVPGPRLVNFAPILQYNRVAVNALVRSLLETCGQALGAPVEIELALTLEPEPRCGFLQVRPMAVSHQSVDLDPAVFQDPRLLVAAEQVLGNGVVEGLRDVVYLRPSAFDPARTRDIAREVTRFNQKLVQEGRPYLLVGFGRWGTSDPTGGIPLEFGQISGVRVIVETQLPNMRADLSQGSHFFHNLTNLQVMYFSVAEHGDHPVDFPWLEAQAAVEETGFVRHLRLPTPLEVRVDGRSGRGVVLRHG